MHQVALLPLVVMLVLLRTSVFSVRQWLLGSALAISWVMDSLNFLTLDAGLMEMITQYGKPLQVAMVLGVIVRDKQTLAFLYSGLAIATFASIVQAGLAREIIVPLLGGFVIALYAWRTERGCCRAGLLTYFGVGAVAWTLWSLAASEPSRIAVATWYGYQATRLTGILLITAALVMHARQPRLELV